MHKLKYYPRTDGAHNYYLAIADEIMANESVLEACSDLEKTLIYDILIIYFDDGYQDRWSDDRQKQIKERLNY